MKAFACLVRQTPGAWMVSIGNAQPMVLSAVDTKPSELANAVLQYLDREQAQYGRCHDRIVLCPESRATLFASGPIPAALKTRDRQQLKYHAESMLPIDAERMAADFVLTNKELRVMAIDSGDWQPIIDAFSARDLHFRWIAPASVLAIEEAKRSISDCSRVVLWEEEGVFELWQLDEAGIVRWTHLADASGDRFIAMRLFAAQTQGVRTWTAINCQPETLERLGELQTIEVRAIELEKQAKLAAVAADRLCRSSFEAWFDLRDGAIAGGDRYRALGPWMRAAAAAVAVCLVAFSAACYWQSVQAEREVARIDDAHLELFQEFKEHFPSVRAKDGSDVAKQIATKHREIQVSTGSATGKEKVAPIPSALAMLHATLTALSGPTKFQTRELRIEDGVMSMELTFDAIEDISKTADQFERAGFILGKLNPVPTGDGKRSVKFEGGLVDAGKANPNVDRAERIDESSRRLVNLDFETVRRAPQDYRVRVR